MILATRFLGSVTSLITSAIYKVALKRNCDGGADDGLGENSGNYLRRSYRRMAVQRGNRTDAGDSADFRNGVVASSVASGNTARRKY